MLSGCRQRLDIFDLSQRRSADTQQKIAAANKVAPGKAHVALDLVGYDDDVAAAMAYVFGDTFICADKQSAQAVTFNKNIGVKSVTLEGDVYDPSGTLSGGAAPSGSGLLIKVQELKTIERGVAEHKKALEKIRVELSNAKKVIDQWRKDKRDLDLRTHEVKLLEEQVSGSNATKVQDIAAGNFMLTGDRYWPKSMAQRRGWRSSRISSTKQRKSKRRHRQT